MLIAFFIVAGLLALANLAAGFGKLTTPKDALQTKGMAYVEDFSATQIKLIGLAEVVGAVGLILPLALAAVLPATAFLSPVAAIALTVIQIGAVVVHARRGEKFVANLAFIVVGIAAAVLGFLAL